MIRVRKVNQPIQNIKKCLKTFDYSFDLSIYIMYNNNHNKIEIIYTIYILYILIIKFYRNGKYKDTER
jgi:hypothetical protein